MTDILVQTRNKGRDYSWLIYDSFKPGSPSDSIRNFVRDRQYVGSFTETCEGHLLYKVTLADVTGPLFKTTKIPYNDSRGNPVVNPQDGSLILDNFGRPISITIVSQSSLPVPELDEIIQKTATEYCTRAK